jgi:hypothetical protein
MTEMYPRIPWEPVADLLRSVEYALGTTGPDALCLLRGTNWVFDMKLG